MLKPIIFTVHRVLRLCCVAMIRSYRFLISPILGQHCRFYPSCAEYAQTALTLYPVHKGLSLAARRLLRCHPFHHGGFDPVPVVTPTE